MSDRDSTEKAFNKLLEQYRQEVLPAVMSQWADLQGEEREKCSKMHSFLCSLHLLVGMADTCSEGIRKFEKLSQPEASDENGTLQLL